MAVSLRSKPHVYPLNRAPRALRDLGVAITTVGILDGPRPASAQQLDANLWSTERTVSSTALSRSPSTPWRLAAMGQPPALDRHTAIYDPVRQRMVVFGGEVDYRSTNDLWQLTLDREPQWGPLMPGGALPSRRLGQSAVYDPVRDRMLVFGGFDSSGVVADVWALSLT